MRALAEGIVADEAFHIRGPGGITEGFGAFFRHIEQVGREFQGADAGGHRTRILSGNRYYRYSVARIFPLSSIVLVNSLSEQLSIARRGKWPEEVRVKSAQADAGRGETGGAGAGSAAPVSLTTGGVTSVGERGEGRGRGCRLGSRSGFVGTGPGFRGLAAVAWGAGASAAALGGRLGAEIEIGRGGCGDVAAASTGAGLDLAGGGLFQHVLAHEPDHVVAHGEEAGAHAAALQLLPFLQGQGHVPVGITGGAEEGRALDEVLQQQGGGAGGHLALFPLRHRCGGDAQEGGKLALREPLGLSIVADLLGCHD